MGPQWLGPAPWRHGPSLSLRSRADDTACGCPLPCAGLLAPSLPSNAPRLPLPPAPLPTAHPLDTCLCRPACRRPGWRGRLPAVLGGASRTSWPSFTPPYSSAHQVLSRAPSSDRVSGGLDLPPTLSPASAQPGPRLPPGLLSPSAGPREHTGMRIWLKTYPLTLGPSPVGTPLLWRACPARPATSLCPRSRGAPGMCRPVAVVSQRCQQQDCPALTLSGPGWEGWWAPASWLAPWLSR